MRKLSLHKTQGKISPGSKVKTETNTIAQKETLNPHNNFGKHSTTALKQDLINESNRTELTV